MDSAEGRAAMELVDKFEVVSRTRECACAHVCACAPATMCVRSRARVQGVPVAASASRGGFARPLSAG